jgi:hypothetical protein
MTGEKYSKNIHFVFVMHRVILYVYQFLFIYLFIYSVFKMIFRCGMIKPYGMWIIVKF